MKVVNFIKTNFQTSYFEDFNLSFDFQDFNFISRETAIVYFQALEAK